MSAGDQHPSGGPPFNASEPGSGSGCRPEDREWIDTYGHLDFPETISNPVDALPPGYPAYTALLHGLVDPDSGQRVEWISDRRADPWAQVQNIADHGLGSWLFAADNAIGQPEGGILADVLGLDSEDVLLTVSYFFPTRAATVHATTIADLLRAADHDVGHVPTFWFPHSRAWVANAPYDAGWTYLASTEEIAQRLLDDPRIETLPCSYREP